MNLEGPSPGILGPNSVYVLKELVIWGCNEVMAGKGKFKTRFLSASSMGG